MAQGIGAAPWRNRERNCAHTSGGRFERLTNSPVGACTICFSTSSSLTTLRVAQRFGPFRNVSSHPIPMSFIGGLVTRWHIREWSTVVGEDATGPEIEPLENADIEMSDAARHDVSREKAII